jgi:GTPase
MGMKPIISVVGRPNVGKSALFNRIIGYRKAITEDTPGVTRDRNYGEFEHNGREFILVDTGGFEPSKIDGYFPVIKDQIEMSIAESSAIMFVLDGKDGLLPQDMEIAGLLRKTEKPVLYVINKMDSGKRELGAHEFYALGTDQIYSVSALHGLGVGDLLDAIYQVTAAEDDEIRETRKEKKGRREKEREIRKERRGKKEKTKEEESAETAEELPKGIRIAIVGRPNTGKSSLTNKLLGSERMIVSEVPGTTRDAIDSKITFRGKDIVLVDTAGLRRKSRISAKVEHHSVASAIASIERANVVNLVIDAAEGVSHQDAGIAHVVTTKGKGICVVVNKWDLLQGRTAEKEFAETVRERIPHASFAPLVFTSALKGLNIQRVLDADLRIFSQLTKRVTTPKLNKAIEGFIQSHSPPHVQGKQIKILYAHQARAVPPTFVLFTNYPESIPEHYKRYLENCLREKYEFSGVPLRLVFKQK